MLLLGESGSIVNFTGKSKPLQVCFRNLLIPFFVRFVSGASPRRKPSHWPPSVVRNHFENYAGWANKAINPCHARGCERHELRARTPRTTVGPLGFGWVSGAQLGSVEHVVEGETRFGASA